MFKDFEAKYRTNENPKTTEHELRYTTKSSTPMTTKYKLGLQKMESTLGITNQTRATSTILTPKNSSISISTLVNITTKSILTQTTRNITFTNLKANTTMLIIPPKNNNNNNTLTQNNTLTNSQKQILSKLKHLLLIN